MSIDTKTLKLPPYDDFEKILMPCHLAYSPASLHGLMTAFLCAGQLHQAESYLRALLQKNQQGTTRTVMLAVFSVFAVTQQQLECAEFEFELMMPDDEASLVERAKAFSEWCTGFMQGLELTELPIDEIDDEDFQDAIQNMIQFSEVDYDALEITEEDERAFFEVEEYARIAVLKIRDELLQLAGEKGSSQVSH